MKTRNPRNHQSWRGLERVTACVTRVTANRDAGLRRFSDDVKRVPGVTASRGVG